MKIISYNSLLMVYNINMTSIYLSELSDSIYYSEKLISTKGYNSIRGRTLMSKDKFILKEVSIENLIECINKKIIVIPEFQRLVNTSKIDNMLRSYKDNPNLFNFMTNPIQLAQLTIPLENITTYYLIDGQHRYYMYKKLYENNINVSLKVCIIKCDTVDEMHDYYNKLNCDNKNNLFDSKEINKYQNIIKYVLLRNEIKKQYGKYFKNNDNYIYSLDEFIKILQNNNFLDYFENTESISNIIMYIIEQNNIFLKNCYNKEQLNNLRTNELNLVTYKYIMAIRNNNFIDFLLRDDDNKPFECIHKIDQRKLSKKKLKKS